MEVLEKTEFKLEDLIGGRPLTADSTSVPLLREFLGEVETLLKGDDPQVSLAESEVKIESGSLKIVVFVESALAGSLSKDLEKLRETADLDEIGRRRGEIIEKWQKRASKNPTRRYGVATHSDFWTEIKSDSPFSRKGERAWVEVEKHLTGKIYDWGGRSRTNLHLELAGTGQVVTVEATEEQIRREEKNYVYHTATVRVVGEQNLKTKHFRKLRLLELVTPPEPVVQDELQELWRKGEKAWKDVESASHWVEELRGNA